MIKINICKDFSSTPGGRYMREGKYSGEEFREKKLIPIYQKAIAKGECIEINFDGGQGFGTSFLEEAFGGLVRKLKTKNTLKCVSLVSTEDETIPDLIRAYVKEAEDLL